MKALSLRRAVMLGIVAITALAFMGCQPDPSTWYPKGSASLASSFEIAGESEKNCVVTLKIANIGKSRIDSSTISLRVTTDARSYLRTSSCTASILPGKSYYFDTALSYAAPTENLAANGVEIVDQYYQ
ncbi:MAG: hypothetical protein Q8M76_17310 [Spirochaetaceae bacterium]|nr:hypothetical protein [Spirochaetaceae bacterium]